MTKEELEKILKMVDETNRTSTTLNDYCKKRRREGVLEVYKMMQQPNTYEEMKDQIFRHVKQHKHGNR